MRLCVYVVSVWLSHSIMMVLRQKNNQFDKEEANGAHRGSAQNTTPASRAQTHSENKLTNGGPQKSSAGACLGECVLRLRTANATVSLQDAGMYLRKVDKASVLSAAITCIKLLRVCVRFARTQNNFHSLYQNK